MKEKKGQSLFLALSLIILAVSTRWLPHTFNFTPVLAIALFSGMYVSNRFLAFLIPALILLLSDAFLGFYSGTLMLAVYGSYALIVGLGVLSKKGGAPLKLLGTSVSSAVIFFMVTNCAVWVLATNESGGAVYGRSLAGLLECYTLALPFFRATLISTVSMSFILVGGYELIPRSPWCWNTLCRLLKVN